MTQKIENLLKFCSFQNYNKKNVINLLHEYLKYRTFVTATVHEGVLINFYLFKRLFYKYVDLSKFCKLKRKNAYVYVRYDYPNELARVLREQVPVKFLNKIFEEN